MYMESVVVAGPNIVSQPDLAGHPSVKVFKLETYKVGCGLIDLEEPEFDKNDERFSDMVLIRKTAFSCNYRDKSLIFNVSDIAAKELENNGDEELIFSCIGSEFVAVIVDMGKNVKDLEIGDRVIPNASYPDSGYANIAPGIPTNEASSRTQVMIQYKLIKVPDSMPDEQAAAFTIGALTSNSMIKKAGIHEGSRILITAGTSNTSLFLINQLLHHQHLYVLTSSVASKEKLLSMGVENVIIVDHISQDFFIDKEQGRLKFDVILDAFIDIHFTKLLPKLLMNGVYVTCGILHQHIAIPTPYTVSTKDYLMAFATIIQNNIRIVGNCLGNTADLEKAFALFVKGELPVIVDSVYTGDQVSSFFERTYMSRERFGKVVYKYS
jgi:NADPH:quinone reductase-like Zn-dependent oxidoreductase